MKPLVFFRLLSVLSTIVLASASGILYSIGNSLDNSISSSSAYHYPHHQTPYAVAYSYINAPYTLPYTAYSGAVPSVEPIILGLKHHHPDHKDDSSSGNPNQNSNDDNKMENNAEVDKKIEKTEGEDKKSEQIKINSGSDSGSNMKAGSLMPQTTAQLKYYTFSYPITYTVPAPLYFTSTSSQFHHQDNAGHYYYGYASPDGSKQELKANDGITRGAYSYIDADGKLQTVYYLSDSDGFRVVATNLPKSPEPVDIPDSPDVQLAKAEHLKAQQEALERLAEANKKDAGMMQE